MPQRPNIPPGPHSRKVNKNTNKTIEQVNKNDRATSTGAVTAPKGTAPALGTTSRAYSLTHGSQQGLGIPLTTLLGGNNGVNSRGGSAPAAPVDPTGGFTPVAADLSKNPYGPAYDQLLSFIQNSSKARGPEYDATAAQLRKIRAQADQDLHSSYLDSRVGADASAKALGVDPNAVSANRDTANRRMQENSDQALADNLAWLQKAKVLQGDNLQGYLAQAAQAKASSTSKWDAEEQQRIADQNIASLQQLAALKRASSSGGGGGSGGSGSSKSKTTVTKTDTLVNSGLDLAAYNQLMASGDKEAAAIFLNQTYANSGNPVVADTQKKINQAASNSTFKPVGGSKTFKGVLTNMMGSLNNRLTAKQAADQKKALQKALNAMLPYSGIVGNPKTSTVVKTTGKSS